MKRLISYSSVAHMGLVILAIFSGGVEGLTASIFLMVAHGLVSSALFIIVTTPYDRIGTRLIKYCRGLAIPMPLFASLLMLFTLANVALSLSCNFIGEFYALIVAFKLSKLLGIVASTGIILSATYVFLLYNKMCFSSPSNCNHFIRDISIRETNVLITLALPTYFLGIFPGLIRTYIAQNYYQPMRIRKQHPLLSVVNSAIVDFPSPSNISMKFRLSFRNLPYIPNDHGHFCIDALLPRR